VSRVAAVFTGGTIAMRHDPAAGGAVPALKGAEILARTGSLDAIAEVEAIDWGLVPASHLTLDQVLDIARTVRSALDRREIDGAVVVHGTDTMEETAFSLDLIIGGGKPVAMVGAMRRADEDGYDGPANLRNAVRAAADPRLREQGTVVVMAGRIFPADDAVKLHTDAYDAFDAPNSGPLGWVDAEGLTLLRFRAARRRIDPAPEAAVEPVAFLTAVSGMDGWLARLAIKGGARGLVIAATGSGNTHPDLLEAAREAMAAGIPVVVTSRCLAGRVQPRYGIPGGGIDWQKSGAILAGRLSGPKARVALALGLGAGMDQDGLRSLMADPQEG
jgi:L-asparaginase